MSHFTRKLQYLQALYRRRKIGSYRMCRSAPNLIENSSNARSWRLRKDNRAEFFSSDASPGCWRWSGETPHPCGHADSHVLHEGGWNNKPTNLQAANRNRNEPDDQNCDNGSYCAVGLAAPSRDSSFV